MATCVTAQDRVNENMKNATNAFTAVNSFSGMATPNVIDLENMVKAGDVLTFKSDSPRFTQNFNGKTVPGVVVEAENNGVKRFINFYLSSLTRALFPCKKGADGVITTDTSDRVQPAGTAVTAYSAEADLEEAYKKLCEKPVKVSLVKEVEIQRQKFGKDPVTGLNTAFPQQSIQHKKLYNYDFAG